MNSIFKDNTKNHPGMHIVEDLNEAERERQESKELQDKKYGTYFLLFQGLIYLIAIMSFGFGNPQKLGKPYDSNQQVCGVDTGLEEYPYIYFVNPTDKKHLDRSMCLKHCPTSQNEINSDESLELECYPNLLISSCKNRPSVDDPSYTMLYYDTVQFLDVCLPTNTQFFENIREALEQSTIITFLSDISNGKLIIFASLALCLLLNQLLYLLLLKLQRKSVWIIAGASIFGLLLSGLLGIMYYLNGLQYQQITKSPNLTHEQAVGFYQNEESNSFIILLVSIGFLLFGLYQSINLYLKRDTYKTIGYKINIVNFYFDYSSIGVQQQQNNSPSRFREILIMLLICSFTLLLFSGLWVWMAVNLFSIGSAESGYYAFNTFQLSWVTFLLGIFHFAELAIITLTIVGTETMLLIGKIVEIYKSQGVQKQKYPESEEKSMMEIFKICMKNNFGSVVFGELLIFINIIPRFCVEIYVFFRKKIHPQYQLSENIEKILSINDRAYLLAFLRNDEFFKSAQSQYAFDQKLQENTDLQHHGKLFQVLYCSAVANLCVSLTYVLILLTETTIGVHQPVYLLIASFSFSYCISMMFSTVYGTTIDNVSILLYRDITPDGKQGTFVKDIIKWMKNTTINQPVEVQIAQQSISSATQGQHQILHED